MKYIIRFDSVEELLQKIKEHLKFLKENKHYSLFEEEERYLIKIHIYCVVNAMIEEKNYKLGVYDIEIGDYYLDEFLSKYEPELWASVQDIKDKL